MYKRQGLRPIVDIYSTCLQRSYDQIFHEVCLQNLPVVFTMDRGGLTAPDGPTHHGTFDIGYMRVFPNMVVMLPGDANDIGAMLDFAIKHDTPSSLRYPKTTAEEIARTLQPVELGKSEILSWGSDGVIIAAGTQLAESMKAAETLQAEGFDVGVVNARFAKPIDREMVRRSLTETKVVVTVEEGMLMGGFGSAMLEAANEMGLNASHLQRIGIPDEFVEHASRTELHNDLKLDAAGIAETMRVGFERESIHAQPPSKVGQ